MIGDNLNDKLKKENPNLQILLFVASGPTLFGYPFVQRTHMDALNPSEIFITKFVDLIYSVAIWRKILSEKKFLNPNVIFFVWSKSAFDQDQDQTNKQAH